MIMKIRLRWYFFRVSTKPLNQTFRYDLDLQQPIPTVAKLVGKSRTHNVCDIKQAALDVREDMKVIIRAFKITK